MHHSWTPRAQMRIREYPIGDDRSCSSVRPQSLIRGSQHRSDKHARHAMSASIGRACSLQARMLSALHLLSGHSPTCRFHTRSCSIPLFLSPSRRPFHMNARHRHVGEPTVAGVDRPDASRRRGPPSTVRRPAVCPARGHERHANPAHAPHTAGLHGNGRVMTNQNPIR